MKRMMIGLILLLTCVSASNAAESLFCKKHDQYLNNVKAFVYSLDFKLPKLEDSKEKYLRIYEEQFLKDFNKADFNKLIEDKDYLTYKARKKILLLKDAVEKLPTSSVAEDMLKGLPGKKLSTSDSWFNHYLIAHIDNVFTAYKRFRDAVDEVESAAKDSVDVENNMKTRSSDWVHSIGILGETLHRMHSCYVDQLLDVRLFPPTPN